MTPGLRVGDPTVAPSGPHGRGRHNPTVANAQPWGYKNFGPVHSPFAFTLSVISGSFILKRT